MAAMTDRFRENEEAASNPPQCGSDLISLLARMDRYENRIKALEKKRRDEDDDEEDFGRLILPSVREETSTNGDADMGENIAWSTQQNGRRARPARAASVSSPFNSTTATVTSSLMLRPSVILRPSVMLRSRRRLTDESETQDYFQLPDSTYTFFITEEIVSWPFALACVIAAFSLSCLALALQDELAGGKYNKSSNYNIEEVSSTVRATQCLGIIIGVLIDEEIPTGLEQIGKGLQQKKKNGKRRHFSMWRIVLGSMVRISVGGMFLACLFFVLIQETTVIGIFFDVVALEFVQKFDDIVFNLGMKGFFGRRVKIACLTEHCLECSTSKKSERLSKWIVRLIKMTYFLTAASMIVGLSLITYRQNVGEYRCKSLLVNFGRGAHQRARVKLAQTCADDSDCGSDHQCHEGFCHEERLLIYSHFNGIYVQHGTVSQRPRYVERNKESGAPFETTVPAEIIYCDLISSWVLTHPNIESGFEGEHACNWLMRSDATESFDMIEMSKQVWQAWTGRVEGNYDITVSCAECNNDDLGASCNYHGDCVSAKWFDFAGKHPQCQCFEGFFGVHCQFEAPCNTIRSGKDANTTLSLLEDDGKDDGFYEGSNLKVVMLYGRPVYAALMKGTPCGLMRFGSKCDGDQYFSNVFMSNATGEKEPHGHYDFIENDDLIRVNENSSSFQELLKNYTFVLRFTGRRWYGQIVTPDMSGDSLDDKEYHAFWSNSFPATYELHNSTLIISDPTYDGSPTGVNFYELHRRYEVFENKGGFQYDYGQYGVLVPLVMYEGAGFFHCNAPYDLSG